MTSYLRFYESEIVNGLAKHFRTSGVRATAMLYSGELEAEESTPIARIVARAPAALVCWSSRSVDEESILSGQSHAEQIDFHVFICAEERTSPEARADLMATLLESVESFFASAEPGTPGPSIQPVSPYLFGSAAVMTSTPTFGAITLPVALKLRRQP